ncbi:PREDICTED: uncharacterized protein LOC109154278 [Ipomoea nil]|uniref:uncharacterized protein LOC109154278 n=1 Tax=Ipomoea nil TaxID=35883 RepID=UPI000901D99D|nr:PREDICTED: uncharacterized protein LOC109154278 [Ipomoea nil]
MPSQYILVKDVVPLNRERVIRIRCVRVYEIPERGANQMKSRELVVCDEEGTFIHVNMQNSDVDKYKNVFQGREAIFSEKFSGLRLNYNTQVKAIKSRGFPTNMFQLKPYQCLKDPTLVKDKVMFDVIGRVIEIHAPLDKIIGGKPAKLIDFKIADNEGNQLKCTVWDNHVASMLPFYNSNLKEPVVVVIQLCRAKIINGKLFNYS